MKNYLPALLLLLVLRMAAQPTLGLISQSKASTQGYILFAPLTSKTTYLIDKCGRLVHSWQSRYTPGQSVYLLPDGSLLRPGNDSSGRFTSGGGKIERFGWNNELLWTYSISSDSVCQHHDIYPMPNGNILVLVWEKKNSRQAVAAGRKPETATKGIWSEKIIELKPIGKDSASVVWQWHIWDHLIQDHDSTKANYGVVAKNPQLVNLNFMTITWEDWLHFNAVAYNAELDQVVVSNRNFSEIFIIDHSTTTAQAATHSGGKRNKGGDLLWRWGNPATYNMGINVDQKLFSQHNAHWIGKGLPDAGKIMVFNNGLGRDGEPYSTVDVIEPSMDKQGNYILTPGKAFGPYKPSWTYEAPNPSRFFSKNISSAQRLKNGHTVICAGAPGKFFEIDEEKNVVWTYVNPINNNVALEQGAKSTQASVFRCVFYEPGYRGFKKKKLEPGQPLELKPLNGPCFTE